MDFPVVLLELHDAKNLEDVSKRLLQGAKLDKRPDGEWPQGETLFKRWKSAKDETIGVNEITSGTDEEFQYIFAIAYVERAKKTVKDEAGRFLDRSDRINKVEFEVLFFEHDSSVFAAVYMNLTENTIYKLRYILKDLMVEDIWGSYSLLPPKYHITDSTYYWILSKFLIGDKVISSEPTMIIKSFTGYSGVSTTEGTHSMTGDGEKISALLSTLAFIFGDDSLKSLKLHVCVGVNDNILFELSHQGNVRILEYDGDFFGDGLYQEKILATLLVYKKIIPQILNTYNAAKDSGIWNLEIKQDFIKQVGSTIIQRVDKELKSQEVMERAMANK
jgi:hypothetical protein